MSGASEQLQEAILEARDDGAIASPTKLLEAAKHFEDPIRALTNWDQANELFDAFDHEFGFINRARNTKMPLPPVEISRYASLIRWLIHELRNWRAADSDASGRLVAIVVAAQVCDMQSTLWASLPDDIGQNSDLVNYLKHVVGAFSVEFTAAGPRPAPDWEIAALAKFKEADASGDWPEIMEGWHLLERQPFLTNALQTQTIRLLSRFSQDSLVEALTDIRQIVVAMQIASALDPEQRLTVSLASASSYFQLAAAYQTVSLPRTSTGLSTAVEQLLTELLVKVMDDKPRWAAWMKIFNTYPVRFPHLQTSLGLALARGPDRAWEPYVESFWLYAKQTAPDAGRQCVASCLRVFRQHAALDRRQALWTAAHNRWLQWNFGLVNSNEHLFRIAWSDLDYALVGYALECMDNNVRNQAIDAIRNELQTVEDRWHESESAVVTEWNRQLSRLQPYAYALNVARDGRDWLSENETCWPFDPKSETYLAIKYRF